MAYFDESNKARSWLMARWAETVKISGAKDAVDRADFQSSYSGAIYDQHDARRSVRMLGADYITNEKRGGQDQQ
jgi:hypothetical protein